MVSGRFQHRSNGMLEAPRRYNDKKESLSASEYADGFAEIVINPSYAVTAELGRALG
jgi:hypothetical protein